MLHEINSVKHSCFESPLMLIVHSICICICIYFEVWGARYIYLCDVYIYTCVYIYIYTYLMSCLMCHIKMNVSCGILHFKWKGWVGRDTKHIGVFRFIPPCNPRLPTLMHGGGWYQCKSQTRHAVLIKIKMPICRCKEMYAKEIETISDRLITLVRRREKRTISVSSECIQFHVMFVCVCFPSF